MEVRKLLEAETIVVDEDGGQSLWLSGGVSDNIPTVVEPTGTPGRLSMQDLTNTGHAHLKSPAPPSSKPSPSRRVSPKPQGSPKPHGVKIAGSGLFHGAKPSSPLSQGIPQFGTQSKSHPTSPVGRHAVSNHSSPVQQKQSPFSEFIVAETRAKPLSLDAKPVAEEQPKFQPMKEEPEDEPISQRPNSRSTFMIDTPKTPLSSITNAPLSMPGTPRSSTNYDDLSRRLSQLNREKQSWLDSAHELERTRSSCQRLQREVDSTKNLLKNEKQIARQWEEKYLQINAEFTHLQSKTDEALFEANEKVSELESNIAELHRNHSNAMERQEHLHATEMDAAKVEMDRIQAQLETQRKNIDAQTHLAREWEDKCICLSEELSTCKATWIKENGDLKNSYEAKISGMTQRYNQQVDQMVHAQQQELESTRKEFSKTNAVIEGQYKSEIAQLKDQISEGLEAKSQVRALNSEVSSLHTRMEEREKVFQRTVDEHRNNLLRVQDEYKAEIDRIEATNKEAVQRLADEHSEEVVALREQLTNASDRCHMLEASAKRTAAELADCQEAKTAYEKECKKHRAKLQELADALQSTEFDKKQLEVEVQSMTAQIADLDNRLEEQAVALAEASEDSTERLNTFRQRLEEAERQLESKQEEASEAMTEASVTRRELAEARAQITAANEKIRLVTKDANEAEARLKTVTQQKNTANELLEEMKKARTHDEQRAMEKDLEITSLRRQLESLQSARFPTAMSPMKYHERKSTTATITVTDTASNRASRKTGRDEVERIASTSPAPGERDSKKARTQQRSFAITGFPNKQLLSEIKSLGNTSTVDSRSNEPLSSTVTHLITSGQLTVKLLSAVLHGCWILPERYVKDSVAHGEWLDESKYGIQQRDSALKGKTMAFTPKFAASRHKDTVTLVAKEGECSLLDTDDYDICDIVMCHPTESKSTPNGMTWEGLIQLVYPQQVS